LPSPNTNLNAIDLSLFAARISAICEEMGAVLRGSAFSPNIRDRLDYSCAIFDARGRLVEQAAAIPVHLGSMAYAMGSIIESVEWQPDHQLILNDPYRGGTHLPDVTVIAPIHIDGECVGYAANRAHHADIGCDSPGGMPLSTRIEEEGLLIPPTQIDPSEPGAVAAIVSPTIRPKWSAGDLAAQFSANAIGVQRVAELLASCGISGWQARVAALNDYGRRLAEAVIAEIPDGRYQFRDTLDGDDQPLPLMLELCIQGNTAVADFSGSVDQGEHNLNCPLSVTAAGVHYVFRCLLPDSAPRCAGAMDPIQIIAPPGSLLNARAPAAVAAGNVETSMRVVDLVCGALAGALPGCIPAASQGSMNNVAMGSRVSAAAWDYYETLAGGCGGASEHAGASARHSHMTNTLNTPIEVMEYNYPIRIIRYQLRRGSGGQGMHPGGDGLVREYQFLDDAQVTLTAERRGSQPWGQAGGEPGKPGRDTLNDAAIKGRVQARVFAGDRLVVRTPGGGGYGDLDHS
jgi:N-methylhydantoinase B